MTDQEKIKFIEDAVLTLFKKKRAKNCFELKAASKTALN